MVNVGYKREDEFRMKWDGFICGYLECINLKDMKFHLHLE